MKSPGKTLLYLLLLTPALGCFSPSPPPESEKPKNRQSFDVILISIDTLRANHLGCYGYHRDTSPYMDSLADSGILFEQTFAQSSWTAPSHQSLFRSRLPSRFSQNDLVIPEAFQRNGYLTAAFVGGGFISQEFGFDRGFQHFREFRKGAFSQIYPAFEEWYLETLNKPNPRFVFLHTYNTHTPFKPSAESTALFTEGSKPNHTPMETWNFLQWSQHRKQYAHTEADLTLNDFDLENYTALYDATIRDTDVYIGNLIRLLKENNRYDQTIIVLLSDHGEEFWDHQALGHGHTLYNEVLQVPLIIKLPRDTLKGTRVETLVNLLDVFPTLLQLAGLEIPTNLEGSSLIPLFREPGAHRLSRAQLTKDTDSIIAFPWKLIWNRSDQTRKLFYLEDDPGETTEVNDHPQIKDLLFQRIGEVGHQGVASPEETALNASEELKEQLRALGYLD